MKWFITVVILCFTAIFAANLVVFILAAVVIYEVFTHEPTRELVIKDTYLINFLNTKYAYLHSDEWALKRQEVLLRDQYKCQICGTVHNLQIHHLRYTNLYHEPLDDLITLCSTCHTQTHEAFGYPKTYQQYMEWDHPLPTKRHKLRVTNLSITKDQK